jgi:hypothetical protein
MFAKDIGDSVLKIFNFNLDRENLILAIFGFIFGIGIVTFGIVKTFIVIFCTLLPIIISKNRDIVKKWTGNLE